MSKGLPGIALAVCLMANHASAQIIYPRTQQQLIQSCYARFALNSNISVTKRYAYCVCWAAVMSRRTYRQTTKTEQQTLSTSAEVCDQELN
jgi:hypothetical protein